MKSEKTASCNSRGIVISYGDRNKHQFVNYDFKNNHVQKIQISGKNYMIYYNYIKSILNGSKDTQIIPITIGVMSWPPKQP